MQETGFSNSGKTCHTTCFSGIKINVIIVSSWAYAHLLYLDMWNMNHVFLSILLTRNKKEQVFFLNANYRIQIQLKKPNGTQLLLMVTHIMHHFWCQSFQFNIYFGSVYSPYGSLGCNVPRGITFSEWGKKKFWKLHRDYF